MKGTNKLQLSTETVKTAIEEYLNQSVFQERVKFHITNIEQKSEYGRIYFEVITEENDID